jgi:hypothetical protein
MCDSSSWESGGRFGALRLYMGRGRHVILKKTDCREKPSDEIMARVASFGFDPHQLRKMENWHGGVTLNRMLSAASALAMSLDIQKHLGTLMFNAIADTGRGTRFFIQALDHLSKRNAA